MVSDVPAGLPLLHRLSAAPLAGEDGRSETLMAALREGVRAGPALSRLDGLLDAPCVKALVTGILAGSPYLTGLIRRNPARFERLLLSAPEQSLAALETGLAAQLSEAAALPEALRALRLFKAGASLLAALADLGGVWDVPQVTAALSRAGDAALSGSVRFLFRQAALRGEWYPEDTENPESGSGFIVLGMGKYGAFELNYSSDIDLIVFYDVDGARPRLPRNTEVQPFFIRLTRDLVRLLSERTADGYVFRTDLRLRPDAGATQVALSTAAAFEYYESFGQNWERAAFIKARAAAGDIAAGRRFLDQLAPFVWRRYLDYAAIADIHAMKRQIHAFRGFGTVAVAGHNVKLGRGGIREIEFFVQTQQLIAGGRQRALRVPSTEGALLALAKHGWITEGVRAALERAYRFLRRIEHRLQMVADEQTHELPKDPDRLAGFARFCGFADREAFARRLTEVLETVQGHYAALFERSPELTAGGANMVFAGEEDDPATIAALAAMGYPNPPQVIATVRGWHRGRTPAVRSPTARERLTEVQPLLIEAFAGTSDPGRALANFDRFLAELPAGVQLFSLLKSNPNLLRLIADIMGTAPRLAHILARRRRLLDAVIDPGSFAAMPDAAALDALIGAAIAEARDFQDVLDRVRVAGSEQAFLIGVRVLSGTLGAIEAGNAYALLAERVIAALHGEAEREMVRAHGTVAGGAAAVAAMGKLGGREMTAASDLDLIVVYDAGEGAGVSSGPRGLEPGPWYTRFTQRLISALSAPTAEGTLYEVDMRLRPSGQKGPIATRLASFVDYQAREAWTWEHMALTRARVITGPPSLQAEVAAAIRGALTKARDREKTLADVRDMRTRIFAEKGSGNIWELKQVRGGLVDLEFIAQYLQLIHAAKHPEVLDQNTLGALSRLTAAGILSETQGAALAEAGRLLHNLTQVLRLCVEGPFDAKSAPRGLEELLARAGGVPGFGALEGKLRDTEEIVAELYGVLVA